MREVFSKPIVENLKDNSEKIEMANAFDVMWAIILALKEASIALQTTSSPLEYNVKEVVGSDQVTKTIKSKLRNVSFEGLTVRNCLIFICFSTILYSYSFHDAAAAEKCLVMTQVMTENYQHFKAS